MTWTRFEDEIELRRLYNKMEVRIKENDVLRAKRSELNKRRDKLLRQRNEVQKKLAEYRPAYQKFLELCEWAGIENKDAIAVAAPDKPSLASIPASLPPRVRPPSQPVPTCATRTWQRRFAIISGFLALAAATILVIVFIAGKTLALAAAAILVIAFIAGKTPPRRYRVLDSGAIYDMKTKLKWYVGSDGYVTQDSAEKWVKELTVVGGKWHLPTIKELCTLYQPNVGKSNIDPLFHDSLQWLWVWSSELVDEDGKPSKNRNSSYARYFDFDYGYELWGYRCYGYYARVFAVRSGRR